MKLKELCFGDFLKPRLERYKPNDDLINCLKRIDKIDFSGKIHLSTSLSRTDMIIIQPGDLVISGINVYKGALAVYEGTQNISATIHYSSYGYDKSIIDVEYLKIFLKSSKFISLIKEQVPGGIKTEIKPKHILPLKITLPDLKNQKKIVEKYNNLKKIYVEIDKENSNQQYILTKLKQTFLREAMQGKLVPQDPNDEPASELLKRIKAEKDKLIKEGKLKKEKPLPEIKPEDIPYQIPDNWVWCRLGEISIKIGSGSTPKGSNYSLSGIPFFRSQNIYNSEIKYDDIKFISENVNKKMIRTQVFSNDLLLNITGGSLGRCSLIPKNFVIGNVSQHVCIIRTILVEPRFMHISFLSPYLQNLILLSTTGAGREGLPKYNLSKFPIPLPPIKEQERLLQKLNEVFKNLDELMKRIIHSQNQSQKLLKATLSEFLIS